MNENTARQISDRISQSTKAIKSKVERWRRLKDLYHNIPVERTINPYPGAANEHVPVMQVKLDALCTTVVGTITVNSPYCLGTLDTDEPKDFDKVSKAIQFFLERGGIEKALRSAAVNAAIASKGQIVLDYVPYEQGKANTASFRLRSPLPTDYVVYPVSSQSLDDATLMGCSFFRRRGQIEELTDRGYYRPVQSLNPTDPVREAQSRMGTGLHQEYHHAVTRQDELIKLWDVRFYDDDEKAWFSATIADGGREFLRAVRIEGTPPDCDFSLKSISGDQYWQESSVANDLQGIQLLIDELLSMQTDAFRWNTFGYYTAPAGISPEEFLKAEPGSVHSGIEMEKTQYHNPHADVSFVYPVIQNLIAYADQITRLPMSYSGGNQKFETATAAAIVSSGAQGGINEFIQEFGLGVEKLWVVAQELLYMHFEDWVPVFGSSLGITENHKELFALPITWKLSNSTLSTSPRVQLQLAEMMLNIAAQYPAAGLDIHEVARRFLVLVERQGFTSAQGLQVPKDPNEIAKYLAQRFGLQNWESLAEVLSTIIPQLQQREQQIGQLAESVGQPGGTPQAPRSPGPTGGGGDVGINDSNAASEVGAGEGIGANSELSGPNRLLSPRRE